MTKQEEHEMHALATTLAALTASDDGWEASRYEAIGRVMEQLTEYCAVCNCRKGLAVRKDA